jgi:hypothetical protein
MKMGHERAEKYAAKHDGEVYYLRVKKIADQSLDKLYVKAYIQNYIDQILNDWMRTLNVKYGKRAILYDKARTFLRKWGECKGETEIRSPMEEINKMREDWIKEGLLEEVFDDLFNIFDVTSHFRTKSGEGKLMAAWEIVSEEEAQRWGIVKTPTLVGRQFNFNVDLLTSKAPKREIEITAA